MARTISYGRPYDMKENVIIIGSGIGGLTCGALLANDGYNVTMLEKNDYIGGACSSYTKDGHTFDRAVHLFTSGLNGPFGILCNRLGLDTLQFQTRINKCTAVKIYKQNQFIPMSLNQGGFLKRSGSSGSTGSSPSKSRKKKSIFKEMKKMNLSARTLLDFGRIAANIMMMNEKKLDRLYDQELTVYEWLNQMTGDPFLHGIFAFLIAGMFAISPKKASAAEFLYCYKKEMRSKDGYQYPAKGAAQAIPNAIFDAYRQNGGKLRLNARVKKIVVEKNRVKGVLVDDELIEAPIVISDVALKMTVTHLVGREYFERDYLSKIESLTSSLSAMTFKLALKEPMVKGWKFVNLYHPTLHDWGDKYGPDAPLSNGFFGPILSNIDPDTAPAGKQTAIFGTIIPSKCNDWEKWRDIYWEDLNTFLPGLESKVDFMDVSYPKDITIATAKPEGPVEGLGLTPEQTGANKPSSVLPVKGLYAVGDTAGKNSHGIGTQLACESGIHLADALCGKIDMKLV